MRPEEKTKSRSKLYNAIKGAKELTGASGKRATMDIVFTNNPSQGETLTVSYANWTSTFTFGDGTGGTVSQTTDLPTTMGALATAMLADANVGAWGFLTPIDAQAITDDSTDTMTLTFSAGDSYNGAVTIGGDAEITGTPAASGGVAAKIVSPDYYYNIIDTTGSAVAKEYYVVADGIKVGDYIRILIKTAADSDTPTLQGHLLDGATPNVEALFAAGEDGMTAEFIWTGSGWLLVKEGIGTALTFTASA